MERTGANRLKLGPALTLANAGEVKQTLEAALTGAGKITLDASAIDEVDLAGLQLICAAHRAAARAGRELEVAGGTSCGGAGRWAGAGSLGR